MRTRKLRLGRSLSSAGLGLDKHSPGRFAHLLKRACSDIDIDDAPSPDSNSSRFPSASADFDVKCSSTRGRYAVATDDVEVGQILLAEEPYVAGLSKEFNVTHCFHCLKRIATPVPCANCASVRYCDETCRDLSWARYHSQECKFLLPLINSGTTLFS